MLCHCLENSRHGKQRIKLFTLYHSGRTTQAHNFVPFTFINVFNSRAWHLFFLMKYSNEIKKTTNLPKHLKSWMVLVVLLICLMATYAFIRPGQAQGSCALPCIHETHYVHMLIGSWTSTKTLIARAGAEMLGTLLARYPIGSSPQDARYPCKLSIPNMLSDTTCWLP